MDENEIQENDAQDVVGEMRVGPPIELVQDEDGNNSKPEDWYQDGPDGGWVYDPSREE
jgi:hypothetical protein